MITETKPLYTKEEWEVIQENDTYCPALFTSLYLNPQNRMSSCCVMDEQDTNKLPYIEDNSQSIAQLLNQDYFKQVRKDSLNGIKNEACKHCWRQQENTPGKEYRYGFVQKSREFETSELIRQSIREDMSVDYTIAPIEHMDVRFSTLCNLRCRSCSGSFSSQWYKEELQLNELHHKPTPKEIWSDPKNWTHGQPYMPRDHVLSVDSLKPHLPHVKRLYFAGGEPTMMKEHYEILQFLIDNNRTDVSLTYNINFSQLTSGKYDVIEYWKRFPHIQIGASLDGSHAKGEYIRKGIVWSEVEKNIQRLRKETPHIGFYISPTTGIMNAYNIVEFHREWVEKGYILVDEFMINILYGPDHYNIRNLPPQHKERLTKIYDEHIEWIQNWRNTNEISVPTMRHKADKRAAYGKSDGDFENLKNFMNNSPAHEEWDRLYWKHFWLDKSRDEDYFEVFPEYKDLEYIRGLGCKSFHGMQETMEEVYFDQVIRLSRGLTRSRTGNNEVFGLMTEDSKKAQRVIASGG